MTDFIARFLGLVGLSVPNFWLATILILVASFWFRWSPALIYVSPFQSLAGEYRMHVPKPEALRTVSVALRQDGETPLTATLRGVRRPASNRWLVRMLLARPLVPQQVAALIRKHGIVLWLRKAPLAPRTPETVGGRLNG